MRSIEFHIHGPIQARNRSGNAKCLYTVFPSLNEVINRARANRYYSAQEKRSLTELVAVQAKAVMLERHWIAPDGPVRIALTWREPTMRRGCGQCRIRAEIHSRRTGDGWHAERRFA